MNEARNFQDEKPKVFVAHGHNELARLQLCEMLSVEFQLHPVVLAQQPRSGRTIIELLEQHASQCVLAMALLTADDVSSKGDTTTARARQNVIFELGYFCSSLGRDRVCLIYQEGVELPSDLSGVLYYPFEVNVMEVQPALRKHMERLGLLGAHPDSTMRVLVVDDDLTINSPLVEQLQRVFAGRAHVEVMGDPDQAVKALSSGRTFLGCITDIVFRHSSSFGGVRVAETAVHNNIQVLIMTGHKKQNIGVALTELNRIGLPEEKILTKPVTLSQYRSFLRTVKGWFIGADV